MSHKFSTIEILQKVRPEALGKMVESKGDICNSYDFCCVVLFNKNGLVSVFKSVLVPNKGFFVLVVSNQMEMLSHYYLKTSRLVFFSNCHCSKQL